MHGAAKSVASICILFGAEQPLIAAAEACNALLKHWHCASLRPYLCQQDAVSPIWGEPAGLLPAHSGKALQPLPPTQPLHCT